MLVARAAFALASLSVAAAMVVACESTPDLEFDAGGPYPLGDAGDATLPVDASDAGVDRDASVSPDASPARDAEVEVDADDAATFADANTCALGSDAPPGAGCCGPVQCIGLACNHCPRCENLACSGATGWCCARETDAGKFQIDQCAADPTDPTMCPVK